MSGQSVFDGPTAYFQSTNHNYGNVRKNALTRWFMQIQNQGDATLTINDIISDNNAFFVDENQTFPINMGIMQSVDIGIWFHPEDAIAYSGSLLINSNDATSPTTILLSGIGKQQDYNLGDELWHYNINTSWDNSPKAIHHISDVNGDEIDDVIICSEDYFVRCFNGNSHNLADVLWELEIYSGNIYNQHGLTTMPDIDGDDVEDVVVGTTGGDRSIHLISGKTGVIIWTHNTNDYGDGGWVYQVNAKYDFNGDNVIDVLASVGDDSNDTGPKRAYCLDGLTGLTIWDTYLGGPGFSIIGIEDFNNDNVADVVAGASNESETEGKIVGLDGKTGNTEWTIVTAGSSVWALTQIDDINSDNISDIVAGDFSDNYYYIDPANGDVLYSGDLGTSLMLDALLVDDVNSDGISDVIFSRSTSSLVMLDGKNASTIWTKTLADKAWNVRKTIELNGDAINDIIVGTLYSNNYVYFLDGTSGDILEQVAFTSAIDALGVIPDIVGDLSEEVVVGGRQGELKCFSGGIEHNIFSQNLNVSLFNVKVFPNPLALQTEIEFEIPETTHLIVIIYNIGGEKVKTFSRSVFTKGMHKIYWDGKDNAGNLTRKIHKEIS